MPPSSNAPPLVSVLMGSKSDWDVMQSCAATLKDFGVAHECRVLSAHRTPAETIAYVSAAEARGTKVIIAAAGGAAHLAGVVAAHTTLPVLGVPMESAALKGLDSLLSTVQMPGGIPVGTLAIGKPGATNAALLAVAILALSDAALSRKLHDYRAAQTKKVLAEKLVQPLAGADATVAGSLLIIVSAVAFGFMALFAHWARGDGVSTEMLLFLRFGIAGTALAFWMTMARERWPRGRDLIIAASMGAALYAGMSLCYFHGLRHIPAGLVALLLYLYPVIVTLLARLFLRERLTRSRLLAIALAVIGLALTIGPLAFDALRDQVGPQGHVPRSGAWLGVALGVGSAACYSVYILIGGSVAKRGGAIPVSTIVMLAAALVFGLIALPRGDALPSSVLGWSGVLGLAVFCTLLAITAFLAGLQRVGAVQASTLSTLEAVTTVIVSAAFLGDSFSPIQIIGGALILVAAIIVARSAASTVDA